MRIVAGRARGTKLSALEGLETRPTTDRVKEAMFNMLGNHFEELIVLDLFAGSGALGLESASRGAAHVTFVESHKEAKMIIEKNIKACHFEGACDIVNSDVNHFLMTRAKGPYDMILMDPPYFKGCIPEALAIIEKRNLLDSSGLIVCEHDAKESIENEIGGFVRIKYKTYGRVGISFYEWSVK